jgi:hypothetical protein
LPWKLLALKWLSRLLLNGIGLFRRERFDTVLSASAVGSGAVRTTADDAIARSSRGHVQRIGCLVSVVRIGLLRGIGRLRLGTLPGLRSAEC